MRALITLFFLILFCSSAQAEESCSSTLSLSAGGPYLLKDVGLVEAEGVNTQDEYTHACGKWSFDAWASYGKPDAAKEFDLSLFYDTKAGPVKLQFAAMYFMLNLNDSFWSAKDDMVELYADASLPIERGKWMVAPLVRVIRMIGVDELQSITVIEPGVRASWKPTEKFTLFADVRDAINTTQGYSTLRTVVSGSYTISKGTSVGLSFGDTDRTPHALYLNVVKKF